MTTKTFKNQPSNTKRNRLLSSLYLAGALSTPFIAPADALEIRTKIDKVDRTGAIEMPLPSGSMVAIGDKVRITLSEETGEKQNIKTRWTVKALMGKTIIAIPDGHPTRAPKVGLSATIDTIANQPPVIPEETTEQKPKVSKIPPSMSEPPVAVPKPEQQEASGDDTKVDTKKNIAIEQAPEKASDQTGTVEDTSEAVGESVKASTPVETPGVTVPKADAPVKAMAPDESKTPEVQASKDETSAQETGNNETSEQTTSSQTDAPTAASTEASSGEQPAAVSAPIAKASDVHECDLLAAHPFDPDAKAAGVAYAQLEARKAIKVCQEAIDAFPEEARFYSQLTRGLHKAGKTTDALSATRKGAELGSGHSMAYLGVMYRQGKAVSKDLVQSLKWFEQAAEKGNPGGMVFAAAMHRDGTATPKDYKKAAALYKQAADLQVAEAMTSLAVFLDRGQGMEKDADEAARYFLKALKGQDTEARKLLYEAPGAISLATRKQIQDRLKSDGFYRGRVDGEFGTGTKNALTLFRRAK